MKYFSTARSGTHNNQWIILNPSNIGKREDLVVYYEEAFSLYKIIDMSGNLTDNGYVASYNSPITE